MRQILAFIVFGICVGNPVVAATFDWSNTLGGNFSTATNWSPSGGPPGSSDTARFSLPNTYSVTLSSSASLNGLLQTHGAVTFDLSNNGTLQLSSQYPSGMGAANLTSTLNISGGDFRPGTFAVGAVANSVANLYLVDSNTSTSTVNGFNVGQAGTGNLWVVGGTLATVGSTVGLNLGAVGNATIIDAAWTDTGPLFWVGGLGTGTLNIRGPGSVTTQGLGVGGLGAGTVSLEGEYSMLAVNDSADIGFGFAASSLNIGRGATATIKTLNLGPSGTLNITGGTLKVKSFSMSASAAVQWTSGTIIYDTQAAIPPAALIAFLDGPPTLGPNCTFASPAGTLSLSTSLAVSGAINVHALTLNTGSILELSNFASIGISGDNSTLTNSGVLDLNSQFVQVNSAMTNNGVVRGTGTFTNGFTNSNTGVIRVELGDDLRILNAAPPTPQAPAPASTNSGRIELSGGTIELPPGFQNELSGIITGRGVIHTGSFRGVLPVLWNLGYITFAAGTTDVYGDVTNGSHTSAIFAVGGASARFHDDVVNQGIIQNPVGSRFVFFGDLSGHSVVSGGGDVELQGDIDPGNSPANISFGGNLQLGFTAALNIELAGTAKGDQYDSVTVAGIASLSGALNVQLIDGFIPQAGQSFSILNAAGGINGVFDNVQLPALAGGLYFDLAQTAKSLTVMVAGIPGDFNRNGIVDSADYTVWRNTRGQTGAALAADANNSGTIDQADYNIWRAHFGERSTAGGASGTSTSPIPEPASLTALVLCIGLLTLRRSPGLTKSRLHPLEA